MANQVTLNVTVNPNGAVSGTGVVTSSIRGMTSTANSNLNSLQSSFSKLDSFIQKATSSIGGFFKTLIASDSIRSFLERLIDVNTVYIQFTSTLHAIKGSAQAARDEFDYLMATSNRLGQNVEDLSGVYTRLAASMKYLDPTGESTRQVFEGVATAASVLHKKGYETNAILNAFEQILSKNKVALEEVQRQLSNRLPDAMGTGARAMKMSQQQFRQAITDGTIKPLEFVLRYANELKKEYGSAAKTTADAFIGQQNRMKNALMALYLQVGQSGAMEGLTKILRTLTTMLSDPSIGQAFGQSLNRMFSMISEWLSKITSDDIANFFDGLSGIVSSFVAIMKDLTRSFADVTGQKADFLTFAEVISVAMLRIVEVVNTLLAGLLAIPAALRYADDAYELFGRVTSPKAFHFGKPTPESEAYSKGTDAVRKKMEADGDKLSKLTDKFIVDGRLHKAEDDIHKTFEDLRKRQADRENGLLKTKKKDYGSGSPLSEDQIKNLSAYGPPPQVKHKKTGRDPAVMFNTDSTALAKAAGTAMLEYDNIMKGNLETEGKYVEQLKIKFQYDRDYLKLNQKQKDSLMDLAKAADEANAKLVSAKAYQADMLSLNKSIYQSQQSLADITEYRNTLEDKNQRDLQEKLRFDAKYKNFTLDMIAAEEARAKALDDLAVKIQNATAAEQSRYQLRLNELQVERDLANFSKGLGSSAYTIRDQTVDSFRKGGDKFNLDPKTKLQMLHDAEKRDELMKQRDVGQIVLSSKNDIKNMDEERQLIGQSTWAIQAYTAKKKVLDELRSKGIDLNAKENEGLKKTVDLLMNDITAGYERAEAASKKWQNGLKSGLQTYKDEISNVAKNMEQMTVRIFKGMEDSLVNFVMTGKLDFKGFATMVISELVRIMIQMTIMQPLVTWFQTAMGFGGSAAYTGPVLGAKGFAFVGNNRYFAGGGTFTNQVVDSPTNFMMGQMGERGPEAVMPLTRDSKGRLGVTTQGGGGNNVNITIEVNVINGQDSTVNVKGADQSAEGKQLADKMKAAALQVIHQEMRAGGVLEKVPH